MDFLRRLVRAEMRAPLHPVNGRRLRPVSRVKPAHLGGQSLSFLTKKSYIRYTSNFCPRLWVLPGR